MDDVKVYEYKVRYCTKGGDIKEYTVRQKKNIVKKIKDKELFDLIKSIKDYDKRKQIKEYLETIKNGQNKGNQDMQANEIESM